MIQISRYNITFEGVKEAERKKATINAISNLSAMFAITLFDKYNWDREQINNLLNQVMHECDCVTAGTVEMKDILQWVLDNGIEIEIPRKER